jgi:exodeoxyribonuclease-5
VQATIELSPEQLEAVAAIEDWWRNRPKQVFTVAGYAGTGKSTVVSFVIDWLDLSHEEVRYAAFTGKAAQVLCRKGIPAQTLHSLIYYPAEQLDGTFEFVSKTPEEIGENLRLIVIDEVSMLSKDLLADLCSYGIPVLALGDPGQLPPPGVESSGLLKNPDVFLTQIHRQAAQSPILWASMMARGGHPIPKGYYGQELAVIPEGDAYRLNFSDFDQVLVCTNKTREWINGRARQQLSRVSPLPEVGDKLICVKNNRKIVSMTGSGLINGLMGYVTAEPEEVDPNGWKVKMSFSADYDESIEFRKIDSALKYFKACNGEEPRWAKHYAQLDWGYAITVHKSQGSEWDRVLFIAGLWGDPVTQRQLLYTGITRAAKHLTLAIGR